VEGGGRLGFEPLWQLRGLIDLKQKNWRRKEGESEPTAKSTAQEERLNEDHLTGEENVWGFLRMSLTGPWERNTGTAEPE